MSAATYETHPLASAINQISGWESLQNFHEPSIATSEQYSNARDKIFSFALALKSLLDSTPYTLISSHGLSQIHAHLQHSINEVANFVANNNPAHLVNAAAHLDQTVVPLVGQYFAFSKITNPLLPAELIEKVKESANSTIKILNEQRNSALLELESLRASISTEHASLAQLAELVAQNKNEAMAINAKIQHDFAEHETRRNSAFTDKMVEIAEGAEFDRNHHKESAKKNTCSTDPNGTGCQKNSPSGWQYRRYWKFSKNCKQRVGAGRLLALGHHRNVRHRYILCCRHIFQISN